MAVILPQVDLFHAPVPKVACPRLGPDPDWFSELYTLAELDRFLADMRARTGQPLTLPHVQTGGPKLDAGALTAAQLRKLRDVYAADYRAFGALLEA